MTSSTLFTVLALISCFEVIHGQWTDKKPSFCRRLECPVYSVTGEGEGYEIRSYEAAKWVSTTVMNQSYRSAGRTAFGKLFSYISGANEGGVKIDMTAPVTARVIPTTTSALGNNMTYSFFIPFEFQDNTPAPTSADVFFTNMADFEVYVRSFGGFASSKDWTRHSNILKAALDNDNLPYDTRYFYTAGYDSPFTLFNRHNEVWYFKTT